MIYFLTTAALERATSTDPDGRCYVHDQGALVPCGTTADQTHPQARQHEIPYTLKPATRYRPEPLSPHLHVIGDITVLEVGQEARRVVSVLPDATNHERV
jgi:hypothetical protein